MKYASDTKRTISQHSERFSHKTGSAKRPTWFLVVLLAALTLISFSLVQADGLSSARSVAMGGAYIGLAGGVDAARCNPANLGLSEYQQTGFEFVGVGAAITNNAFTLSEYNQYSGAILTDEDKRDILRNVPEEGLNVAADVEASALSVSKGPFAFTVSGVGLADVNLNKDLLDLILNGNSFEDTISVTGSYSDAVAYISASLSYGRAVYTAGTRQLAVGATVKYLHGLGVERVVELEGIATTLETGFEGDGRLIVQTATGGSGIALDVGAVLRLNDDYTVGVGIDNFLSSLSWSKNTEEHGYLFSFDTMTVDNMNEDYIVSDDYSKEISGFSTNLPSVMNVGVANTSGALLWAIDWEQGFRRAAGATTKPRLSAGLEWWPTRFAPLRSGFSIGGNRSTALSFGSGINAGPYYLDFAVVTGATLSPYSTKGLNLSFSTGLHF
jgi:hypothetical protein